MKSQRGNTNQIVKDGMNIVINEIIKQIERINNNLYQNVDFYVRVCVCVCVCVSVCKWESESLCDEGQTYTKNKW